MYQFEDLYFATIESMFEEDSIKFNDVRRPYAYTLNISSDSKTVTKIL